MAIEQVPHFSIFFYTNFKIFFFYFHDIYSILLSASRQSIHQMAAVHFLVDRLCQGSQGQWFISLFVRQCVAFCCDLRFVVRLSVSQSGWLSPDFLPLGAATCWSRVPIVHGWQAKLGDQAALAPVEPQIRRPPAAPPQSASKVGRESLRGAVTIWVAFPLAGLCVNGLANGQVNRGMCSVHICAATAQTSWAPWHSVHFLSWYTRRWATTFKCHPIKNVRSMIGLLGWNERNPRIWVSVARHNGSPLYAAAFSFYRVLFTLSSFKSNATFEYKIILYFEKPSDRSVFYLSRKISNFMVVSFWLTIKYSKI